MKIFIQFLLNLFSKLFEKKSKQGVVLENVNDHKAVSQRTCKTKKPTKSSKPKTKRNIGKIDWKNPQCKISKHFTVKEATYLPAWRVYHKPSVAEKKEILKLAKRMDVVRDFLEKPIRVHVWMRPAKVNAPGTKYHGKNYNRDVYVRIWKKRGLSAAQIAKKKATNSAHKYGMAIDWSPKGMKCAAARKQMVPKLKGWGKLRMEDIKGNWIHNDTHKSKSGRLFFKP